MIIDNTMLYEQILMMMNNVFIQLFLIAVIVDLGSGFTKAFVNKCLDSTIARRGLMSHLWLVLGVLVVTPYLKLLGMETVANTILIFYIVSYAISFLENLSEMGIWIPEFIKDKLNKLKGGF